MKRKAFLLLIPLLMLFSCKEPPPLAPKAPESNIPWLRQSYPWADTLLNYMTLEEKAAQLLIVDGGKVGDTAQERKNHDLLFETRVGGIMLEGGESKKIAQATNYYQSISALPLWIGKKEGLFPADPGPLTIMGATGDTRLLQDWARSTASHHRGLGINLDLSLPAQVNAEGLSNIPALSDQPDSVTQKVSLLLEAFQEEALLTAASPRPVSGKLQKDSLTGQFIDPRTPWEIENGEWKALGPILKEGLGALQMTGQNFPALDSTSSTPLLTGNILHRFFRLGLKFDGLIFSPDLRDSSLYREGSQTELAVECLKNGMDVLLFPNNPQDAQRAIVEAVKDKEISEEELDEKVLRILKAKAWAGLDCWPPVQEERLPKSMPVHEVAMRRMEESALTLVKNEKDRLPLGVVVDLEITSLSIGAKGRTTFQRQLNEYQDLRNQQWSTLPDSSTSAQRLASLYAYKYVIVSNHEALPGDTLPHWLVSQLQTLDEKSRLIFVNFADPTHLRGLDSLTCLVQAFGNQTHNQELAGQLVFGGTRAGGKLPRTVSPFFATGRGLQLSRHSRIGFGIPEDVGLPGEELSRIDSIARQSINMGAFPGCQVAVACKGKLVFNKGYGYHSYDREHRVTTNTIYDLASLTKVCATTIGMMGTVDQELVELQGKLVDYLPVVDTSTVEDLIVEEMLLHRSGLSAGLPTYEFITYIDSVDSVKSLVWSARKDSAHGLEVAENLWFSEAYKDTVMERIKKMRLVNKNHYTYSDLGFFLLKELLESVHEEPLNQYMAETYYHPLGLRTTGYKPLKRFKKDRIPPTEKDRYFRKQLVHGYVHDESAALMGGVSGHAGLFSSAEDLVVLMQMLLNKGYYGGRRYMKAETVELFTQKHPNSYRGLGWDKPNFNSTRRGLCIKDVSPGTFGHTGFTGTCVWVDPEHEIIYVFLSNRVHPNRKNQRINGMAIRQSIQQVIYDALGVSRKKQEAEAEPVVPKPPVSTPAVNTNATS